MDPSRLVGLGCMRLSTAAERDETGAVAVIRAALEAGATLLDTADAYAHDEADRGHNERLIARALDGWRGPAPLVATKGGLTRPGGRWVPDGRARHLSAACEASCAALGVDRIDLYQLHAVDPRTPLATSVRALARLRDRGLVRHVGLCNVTVGQIEEAATITPIDAVQVALGAYADEALRNGVAEHCRDRGILLIAHSPLGGPRGPRRLARDAVVTGIAARLGVAPAEVVLAWLRGLAPVVVAIPGATRVETARSAAAAAALELPADDRAALDARFPAARSLRTRRAERRPPHGAQGEVVLIMGCPAAGKTSAVRAFVDDGYERLNRDVAGGRLADLVPVLERRLRDGGRRLVLDNTYPTRASRHDVIETAWRHRVPVRCRWLTTTLEEAQVNAAERLVRRYGELPGPARLEALGRDDPNAFPPRAQFDYERRLEPPVLEEGFTAVEPVPFRRTRDVSYRHRALIVEYEDVLRVSRSGARGPRSADDVEVIAGRGERLRRYRDEGWILVGLSWLPGAGEDPAAVAAIEAAFARTHEALGVAIEPAWCPHPPGPPVCWCRKPLPGLGVLFVERHHLDPARCLHVGRSSADRTFARRLGFEHVDVEAFFEG